MTTRDWHAKPIDDCWETLDSDPAGLSDAVAETRREEAGENDITTEDGASPIRVFLDQFSSALIWILLIAAALSLAIGHIVDAVLIGIILLANGIFGFVQEYRAEQSLQALREMAGPEALVRRGGRERTIPATELVPGDVVVLEQGDVVPADCRLVETTALEVDEAPLTGESLPVEKSTGVVDAATPLAERSNQVFKGTNVTRGDAVALVVETGMSTAVGDIATALQSAEDTQTPLQRALDTLGRKLGAVILVLSAILVPVLVLGGTSLVDAGLTAISLSVAAIPEGLPAVVTLTLALGVRRMADENALVRTLPAVEGLGSIDVVCTDKTGTLTEGEMRVSAAWIPDRDLELARGDGGAVTASAEDLDERFERLFEIGAVCNDATPESGDPTERALVNAATEVGIDPEAARQHRPRVDVHPFSSERKRMTTIHEDVVYVKGAPAVVLDRSTRILGEEGPEPMDDDQRSRIERQIEALADDALRVLAFAYTEPDSDPDSDLVFVGLQGLRDPPRPEVSGPSPTPIGLGFGS